MPKRSRGDGLTSRTAQDSGGDHVSYRNPTKKALVAAIERMVPVDRDKWVLLVALKCDTA